MKEATARIKISNLRFLREYQKRVIHPPGSRRQKGKDRFLLEMAIVESIPISLPSLATQQALVADNRTDRPVREKDPNYPRHGVECRIRLG